MTHRFHPLYGRELELLERRRCWGVERVFWVEGGAVRSLPAAWTSEAEEDGFVVLSGGRSAFRAEDLLVLAELLAGITAAGTGGCGALGGGGGAGAEDAGSGRGPGAPSGGGGVKEIMPYA